MLHSSELRIQYGCAVFSRKCLHRYCIFINRSTHFSEKNSAAPIINEWVRLLMLIIMSSCNWYLMKGWTRSPNVCSFWSQGFPPLKKEGEKKDDTANSMEGKGIAARIIGPSKPVRSFIMEWCHIFIKIMCCQWQNKCLLGSTLWLKIHWST